MPICDLCTGGITNKTPGLKCCGPCEKFFHGKCVSLNKQDLARFVQPDALWLCPSCRKTPASKRTSVIGSISVDHDEDTFTSATAMGILRNIQSEITSLNKKYDEVLTSVNFCSDQISYFEDTMKKFNDKLSQLQKITEENVELKKTVQSLSDRVEVLEQNTRANNLEIQGVPEKNNENLYDILGKIGDHIQCTISKSMIDSVHRVFQQSQQSKNLPKPIIVKFISKQKKEEILASAKNTRSSYNNPIGPGLIIDNVSKKLFINEHLTGKNKSLLMKSKNKAKEVNIKYIWVRNGTIFARKDDTSRILKISSEEDLNNLN